jgi:hypothetical protein
MATSEFTEFSFGYALTDSLVGALGALSKAPVFPSLIQEGSSGGGYDIELPTIPIPLFLQFKIQQVMVKASTLMPPGYAPVYYRMPLRTKAPNQHRLLIALESSKPHAIVRYATPLFHAITDLDKYYLARTVHTQTAFLSPSAIGRLDAKPHHISYSPGAPIYWRHSRPEPLDGDFGFGSLVEHIEKAAHVARSGRPDVAALQSSRQRLAVQREAVSSAIESFRSQIGVGAARALLDDVMSKNAEDPRSAATRLSYVAQVHFGVTVAWLEGAEPLPIESEQS